MSTKRTQPAWSVPANEAKAISGDSAESLRIYNSLTRSKNLFQAGGGKRINWYNCGPTVYDSSHMGHARSYITFDIIRRILRDYFGYDLFFVQNVTDVDDKIIHKARQNHLYEKYCNDVSNKSRDEVLTDARAAVKQLEDKMAKETDPDKKTMQQKMFDKASSVLAAESATESAELVKNLKDVLSIWLDKQFGNTVTDNDIFISVPRFYENEYNEDMKALNILAPDCVTRVSEFIDEIVVYVQKIIDNGYAYASNGSVYFDTEKFANSPKHFYAKLVPEAYGDRAALAEGEGDLGGATETEKRSQNDFALWKASKPGEPSWQSPWGMGRPGWHIECSVMASDLIGEQMDIHSGGIDLRFPHHDNEMAQAEAYYDTEKPWVNYFLHSGHLTIAGCKMSKSLKNFITIREALEKNSARQLRIAFLLHSWKDTLDYSDNTMNDAIHFEKTLNEFFLTVKDVLRNHNKQPVAKKVVKWTQTERALNDAFQKNIGAVDSALKDNIDTKSACEALRKIVNEANVYIAQQSSKANADLLRSMARYITRIMDVFGCGVWGDSIGFPSEDSSGGSADREETLLPFLDVISNLRSEIRIKARELKSKELFVLCDSIRDDILPELGVRMEDYETNDGELATRLKLVDKAVLLKEREEKAKLADQKKAEKEAVAAAKLAAKQAQPPPPNPATMFLEQTDKYSKWNENGVPTHDKEGNELAKSALKKIDKIYEGALKKWTKYQAELQS